MRHRRLPAGLPPHLVNRIARTGGGGMAYAPGLGALGFSLKSVVKGVTKAVTKVAQVAVAPVKLGIEAPLKAVAWTAAQTGIGPVKQFDSFLNKDLKQTVADTKTSLTIGAAVGTAILTGGTIGVDEAIKGTLAVVAPKVPSAVQGPDLGVPSLPTQVAQMTPPTPQVAVAPQQPGLDPATGLPLAPQAGMIWGVPTPYVVGGAAAVGILLLLIVTARRPEPRVA